MKLEPSMLYILEYNSKTKYFYYIQTSLIWSIIFAIHLSNML